jgi:hypothetical protein
MVDFHAHIGGGARLGEDQIPVRLHPSASSLIALADTVATHPAPRCLTSSSHNPFITKSKFIPKKSCLICPHLSILQDLPNLIANNDE